MDVVSSRTRITTTCDVCGKSFLTSQRDPRKTCSAPCRRESQARQISAYRNREKQLNQMADGDGRLPSDPSPTQIAEMCREFRFAHYDKRKSEPNH